jgi:Phospholipase_D-nuclease N-terminal
MHPVTADVYGLSTGVIVALGLLGLLQLGLMVWAVLDIVQRPAVLWGQKWIWLVIVIVFSMIGPIVYFAVGRAQPPVPEPQGEQATVTDRAAHAADLLYGPRTDGGDAKSPEGGSSRD